MSDADLTGARSQNSPETPSDARRLRSPTEQALGAQPGTVYLVGAGPGDPELFTIRGDSLVSTADVVLHDALVPPALLRRVRPDADVRFVGKRGDVPAEKQAKQAEIDAELVRLAREGRSVVRLKGGDPFLFGRGSEEAETLANAGVPFEVIPGVASPFAAAAYAGMSLTHRDLASSVTFVSATTRDGALFDFSEIEGVRGTICVLMGVRRLDDVARALARGPHRSDATPAAILHRGTWPAQRVITAPLGDIAHAARAASIANPALLVVGDVVRLRDTIRWFDKKPLFGKRVLVTRPEGQAEQTARLVRLRGAEPIAFPAIVLRDPPDRAAIDAAIDDLASFDLVAFTSENGVERFLDAMRAKGRDARAFGRAKIAAIGPGTAAAITDRGLFPDIVPKTFIGEALAEAVWDGLDRSAFRSDGAPKRVLVPRAKVAREVLPATLRGRGCDVTVLPVYETTGPDPSAARTLIEWLENKAIDVIMLTSSSTADKVCDLLGQRAPALLRDVTIASIGPITTGTATKRGLSVAVTSDVNTTVGLLDALERHLRAQ